MTDDDGDAMVPAVSKMNGRHVPPATANDATALTVPIGAFASIVVAAVVAASGITIWATTHFAGSEIVPVVTQLSAEVKQIASDARLSDAKAELKLDAIAQRMELLERSMSRQALAREIATGQHVAEPVAHAR